MIYSIIAIIFESFSSLFKSIDTFLNTRELTIGAILMGIAPFIVILNRITKEKEKRARAKRVELRQLRIESKIDDLMRDRGVVSTWSFQETGSNQEVQRSLKRLRSLLQAVNIHQKRRMSMLTNLFKTSVSKKLIALFLGAAVAILNKKLGLDLTPDELLTFLIVVGSYILGQSHIDARKVTAGIKDSPLLQMGFTEAIPILSEIHNGINSILEDVKKNDGTQAYRDAMQAYAQIKPILDALKHPEPLAVIVEDKVAS